MITVGRLYGFCFDMLHGKHGNALSESYAMINFSFKYFHTRLAMLISRTYLLGPNDSLIEIRKGGGVNKAHFVTQPNLLITPHT